MRVAFAAAVLPSAAAHYTMTQPLNWHDANGLVGVRAGGQCSAGCSGKKAPGQLQSVQYCDCQWYTNYTFIPEGVPVTIARDSPMRTYTDTTPVDGKAVPIGDWTARHPWRAPGTAPVNSPCGVDGGNADGCPPGNPSPTGCAGGGYGHGPDATKVTFPNVVTTAWRAGSVVEARWSTTANHGGGYSYRLCKKPSKRAGGNAALTEECFTKMPLSAIGSSAALGNGTRVAIPAMREVIGGVQWTRNPIPACAGPGGGSLSGSGLKCDTTQFPPPFPGLYGFGNCDNGDASCTFTFQIVDELQVPADAEPGDYVLSQRFDSEQTSQVWFTCADIRITA